ncbi:MAG TPA: hypothetical protein VG935_02225 [Patescibacteria group bacterium]|nr:hypothetical protein [Patescibacteria group bacterium]
MLPEYFVYIGIAITASGGVKYLIETLKGEVQPNRVTWFLWSLSAFIAFFAQISQGVGIIALLTFVVAFLPFLVFCASFLNKKAHWALTRFDLACGALSIVGLIAWGVTKEGNIAIFFSILADLLASFPTFVKSYTDPQSESASAYSLNAVGDGLLLLTIKTWDFAHAGFAEYLFLNCLVLIFLIKSKIGVKKK